MIEDEYIKPVQRKLGLNPDGVAGFNTWRAIVAALGVEKDDWNTVRASSFADAADVVSWNKWVDIYIAEGFPRTVAERKAFAKGDNGIGKWGHHTAQDENPMAALPREIWHRDEKTGGAMMEVRYNGKTVRGILGDTMPALVNIKNGAGIDLNPAFAKQLGLNPPFLKDGLQWRWI